MHSDTIPVPAALLSVPSASPSLPTPALGSSIAISGRSYLTADRLATTLGVSARTVARWDAARIGPPKIKVGKLVLFDEAKLVEWLASRETEPVRVTGRRR